MPLFKVRFEVDLMVVADSPEEAEAMVLDVDVDWYDEVRHGQTDATEVTKVSEIPFDWQGSIPWGATDELTCKQVLMEALDEKT